MIDRSALRWGGLVQRLSLSPRSALVLGLYAVLALLVVPVFPHFRSSNEVSRWITDASLVEHGSLEVSDMVARIGGPNEDMSKKDGRLYSNKAPGLALVALPGYLVVRALFGAPGPANLRAALFAMRLLGATLPALLLGLMLSRAVVLLCGPGAAERVPPLLLLLIFGTPLFAYGLLLFAHALVACALFGSWYLLFVPRPGPSVQDDVRSDLGAGALLGVAVLSEYPALVPAAIIVVGAASQGAVVLCRRLGAILLGGLPFAVVLLIYNLVCFDGPFQLSSSYEIHRDFAALRHVGLFGITWPTADGLLGLLVGPSRGLLVFSPALLLCLPAFLATFLAARRRLPLAAALVLVAVPLSLLCLYAGFRDWHGGATVGGRYLVPALPFLILPMGFRDTGKLLPFLLGASVLAVSLTTLGFPFLSIDIPVPWYVFGLPLLRAGLIAPNLLHYVARPLAIGVPLLIVLAAAVVALGRRRAALALLGALCALGGSALRVWFHPVPRDLRVYHAFVRQVYFGQSGTLEREFPGVVEADRALEHRLSRALALPPGPWPF